MLLILLAGLTMMFKDVLSTANVLFLGSGHTLLAGVSDGMGDVFTALSVGVGGATAVTHGFCLLTVGVLGAMAVASVAGTFIGVKLTKKISCTFKSREAATAHGV